MDKKTENIFDNKNLYKIMLDNIVDGIYFVDTERKILYWNKAAERITGYSAEEVTGSHCYDNILIHTDENGTQMCFSGLCPLHFSMEENLQKVSEAFLKHKEGYRVPIIVKISPVEDETGKVVGAVEMFTSNIEKLHILDRTAELENLGLLDKVTGILNRKGLEHYLKLNIDNFKKYKTGFGVIIITIDNFYKIKAKHGTHYSEKIISIVAETLISNLKSDFCPGIWDSEKFTVILPFITKEELNKISGKITNLIRASRLIIGDEIISITVQTNSRLFEKGDDVNNFIKVIDEKKCSFT